MKIVKGNIKNSIYEGDTDDAMKRIVSFGKAFIYDNNTCYLFNI